MTFHIELRTVLCVILVYKRGMDVRVHEDCAHSIAPISSQVGNPALPVPVLLPYAEDQKLQEVLSQWYLAGFYQGRREALEELKGVRRTNNT